MVGLAAGETALALATFLVWVPGVRQALLAVVWHDGIKSSTLWDSTWRKIAILIGTSAE